MLWELLRRGHRGRILSACCVRYGRDLAYRAIHDELMRRHPNYTYLRLTTREATDVGHKVYIQDLITSGQLEERLGQPLEPGADARLPVRQSQDDRRAGEGPRERERASTRSRRASSRCWSSRGFQADQANIKFKGNIHYEEYW